MSIRWATFAIAVQIAFRNLFANRWKTLTIGGITGTGAFLVVLSTSLLDSVDRAMSRSIIGSVAGNIQVFSAHSQDELDVLGGGFDANSLEPLPDFARVRQALVSVDNVARIVPMGLTGATLLSGNTADRALVSLRKCVTEQNHPGSGLAISDTCAAQKQHVLQIATVLAKGVQDAEKLQDPRAAEHASADSLARATSSEFWSGFERDPLERLEFLENRIAPLANDADALFLHYVGTDPQAFAASFERMTIVDGQAIPEGQRGLLFSKYIYEQRLKLKCARNLDKIHAQREIRGAKLATDDELARLVLEGSSQVKELLLELDGPKTLLFRQKLQAELHSSETDVGNLLSQFMRMDDSNFERRYAFFYRELAPSLELYSARVGDMVTVRALSRGGYVQSVNLKVYGTFAFRGLESSPQAGALNMIDLVSFRDLSGTMTDERAREIDALRRSTGARDVSREDAENVLFAVAPPPGAAMEHREDDLSAELAALAGSRRQEDSGGYDAAELQRGVILNAAILLKDDTRAQQTLLAIESAAKRAGLPLKVVSWQKAAGIVGQFVVMARAVLFIAMAIVFVVVLVIINNSLVMATLERVREIGTLRAVGAPRGFVLAMLVLESIALGLVFGGGGAAVASGLVAGLGRVGIPARSEVLTFFFSGPRLYPSLSLTNLGLSLSVVLAVSVLSSIFPAWIALRVSPRQAMQMEE